MSKSKTTMTVASILRGKVASARSDAKFARNRLAEARADSAGLYDSGVQEALDLVVASGLKVCGTPYLYRTWSGNSEMSVTVEVDSLKAPAVIGLIAALDAIAPAARTEDQADEWSARRNFTFRRDGLQIRLHCDIKNGSETCKRVKVGTELKEVPKYAIVCD